MKLLRVKGRIHSLDTLKGIALFFVVYIHARPFLSTWIVAEHANFVIANIARFAVPAFFLTSGYLMSIKLGDDSGKNFAWSQARRLGKYYVIASLVYLPMVIGLGILNRSMEFGSFSDWLGISLTGIDGVIQFFYVGKAVAPFLWFLPALVFSLLILQKAVEKDLYGKVLVASGALHVVAILANGYMLADLPVPVEDALFFGLFFTAFGLLTGMKELDKKLKMRHLKIALPVFILLNLVERGYMSALVDFQQLYPWDTFYFWGPYSFFTVPMVITMFLLMLKNPDFGKDSRLNLYGKHTLTGYLIHPLIIGVLAGTGFVLELTSGLAINGTLVWDLLLLPASYVLTMELAVTARKKL